MVNLRYFPLLMYCLGWCDIMTCGKEGLLKVSFRGLGWVIDSYVASIHPDHPSIHTYIPSFLGVMKHPLPRYLVYILTEKGNPKREFQAPQFAPFGISPFPQASHTIPTRKSILIGVNMGVVWEWVSHFWGFPGEIPCNGFRMCSSWSTPQIHSYQKSWSYHILQSRNGWRNLWERPETEAAQNELSWSWGF